MRLFVVCKFVIVCSQRAVPGEYIVSLSLDRDDVPEHEFSGEGSTPYEAIREASKKVSLLSYFLKLVCQIM